MLCLALILGCGSDDPMSAAVGSGELVGTWTLRSTTDPETPRSLTFVFRANGTLTMSAPFEDEVIGGTYAVDEDADILTITLTAEGRTQTVQGTYEVEAGLLTFTHDGATEVYQRDDE